MVSHGQSLIVSVSGGPDSTALLLFLSELAKEIELKLHVWHLNHLIRPEAIEESDYVRRISLELGLDCTIDEIDAKKYSKDHKLSVQESGREIRYKALEALREQLGADKIAIGHHADDSVETFFINLFRGTGPRGLRGIAPCNDRIIRPLIDCRRADIIEYLRAKKIDFMIDSSNLDPKYLRNRIRHELIPLVNEFSPTLSERIKAMGEILNDEERCLSEFTDQKWHAICRADDREVSMDLKKIAMEPLCFQRRLIRRAVEELTGPGSVLDFKSVESIIDNTLVKKMDVELADGLRSARTERDLVIYKNSEPIKTFKVGESGGCFEIDQGLVSVTISSPEQISIPPKKGTQLVDAEKIEWPIEIRSWKPGDWFIPLGMGGRKKLQDFFIDVKISRRFRSMVPIFCDRNKILAVGDLRVDERVKLSGQTKRVIVLTARIS